MAPIRKETLIGETIHDSYSSRFLFLTAPMVEHKELVKTVPLSAIDTPLRAVSLAVARVLHDKQDGVRTYVVNGWLWCLRIFLVL